MDAAGATQWLYEFATERQGCRTWLIGSKQIGKGLCERVMGVVRGRRVPVPGGAAFPSWREMWSET